MNTRRKEKIGDWLLDVGKYMATAILLSELFSDITNPIMAIVSVITTIAAFALGVYLVGKD